MSQELITKYEAELARLDALYANLEVLWAKMPRLFWLAALAPLVTLLTTLGWGILTLLLVGVLVGSQAYLLGLRKSENRWNRQQVASDLAQVKAEHARGS